MAYKAIHFITKLKEVVVTTKNQASEFRISKLHILSWNFYHQGQKWPHMERQEKVTVIK